MRDFATASLQLCAERLSFSEEAACVLDTSNAVLAKNPSMEICEMPKLCSFATVYSRISAFQSKPRLPREFISPRSHFLLGPEMVSGCDHLPLLRRVGADAPGLRLLHATRLRMRWRGQGEKPRIFNSGLHLGSVLNRGARQQSPNDGEPSSLLFLLYVVDCWYGNVS